MYFLSHDIQYILVLYMGTFPVILNITKIGVPNHYGLHHFIAMYIDVAVSLCLYPSLSVVVWLCSTEETRAME